MIFERSEAQLEEFENDNQALKEKCELPTRERKAKVESSANRSEAEIFFNGGTQWSWEFPGDILNCQVYKEA